jgi:DNA polymerase-3 subunit delta'
MVFAPMLDSLIIHPATRRALLAYIASPPHALLFVGPSGVGKFCLAHAWALELLAGREEYITVIAPDDKGGIGIEAIRELYKTTHSKNQRQVVIIDHAEGMSVEAENAFLKLLEEPRAGLQFVLTTPHITALLPTIRSRVQVLDVRTVPDVGLEPLLTSAQPADKPQLLFIANGRPAVLAQLLANTEAFTKAKQTMQRAKELLAAKPYERMIAAGELASDRQRAIEVLEAMLRMASLQLKKTPGAQHWLTMAERLETALANLDHNANVKIQLLDFFVHA